MGNIKIKRNNARVKNKSFLIALTVCLVAAGLSFFAALTQVNDNNTNDTSSATIPSQPQALHEANKTVSDVTVPPAHQTVTKTDTDAGQDSVATNAAPLYSYPVTGEIIKDFDDKSLQYSQTFGDWRLHLGVDIAASQGTPIYSCSYGTVEDIYQDRLLGTVVAIDHGEGLMGYYCGLNSATFVSLQQEVQPGSQIGIVDVIPGECEEQEHFHFAMEKDGIPISPLTLLNQ